MKPYQVSMYAPEEHRELAVQQRIAAIKSHTDEINKHMEEIKLLTHQKFSLAKRNRITQLGAFISYFAQCLVEVYENRPVTRADGG